MKRIYLKKEICIPAVTLLAATSAGAQKIPEKPNILLIITDQQSSESMSNVLGTRYINTPNMDYLARNGISFTNAYCANPLSIPSRSSMFTGRYPHETGLQSNDSRKIDPLEFPAMGTVFSRAGYETGYAGKWHLPYNQKEKDSHGFSYMENIKNNGIDSLIPGAVINFLKRSHDKPFLAVASFVNPHNICEWARSEDLPDGEIGVPPAAEKCPPLRANSRPSENEADIMNLLRMSYQASPMFPVSGFTDNKWRQYIWAYYRMIEKTDREIGRILDFMRESGLDRNTIVVFLADHGDCQGAHRWNQKTVFFEEASKVPFIKSYPGIKQQRSGFLTQAGTDLLPTLCDLAGVEIPGNLPGISLKPLIADGKMPGNRDYIVVSDMLVQGDTVDGVKPSPEGRMLRNQRFKYWVLNEGKDRETLFDLQNDPGEMVNLAGKPEYKNDLENARRQMAEWAVSNRDTFLQYLIR